MSTVYIDKMAKVSSLRKNIRYTNISQESKMAYETESEISSEKCSHPGRKQTKMSIHNICQESKLAYETKLKKYN